MRVIGKLIKKTYEIQHRRLKEKAPTNESQVIVLNKLLEKAKKTNFGQAHGFDRILDEEHFVSAYQESVPIVDYNEFYDKWLVRSIEGDRNHTWPGRIRHYALSSGTTGSPSKRIPVTTQMIRSFQKSTLKQYSSLHELNLPEEFYGAAFLAVGGSSRLVKKDNHLEGDLSGILRRYAPLIVSPLAKPGRKIAREADWNKKLELMVEKAPEWNIGTIAGIPAWCILLMERIIERHGVKTIHDIWPNLHVYAHGGVFMDPYVPRLEKVIGRPLLLMDTYLTSEGYFAYQEKPDNKVMKLILNSGVFFEFIPFTSDYFDSSGEVKNRYQAYTVDEVSPGVDYALVISTNAGLWRYLIGDLVQFTDPEKHELRITGRIKQFLSLVGEHISLDNINMAIDSVAQKHGVTVCEFSIIANESAFRHDWFISLDQTLDGAQLIRDIDQALKSLNDDYYSARKVNLKEPTVRILSNDVFIEFLNSIGKAGSQNKFPRVLNKDQGKQWLDFLSARAFE